MRRENISREMKEPDLEDCGQLLQRYYELKTSVPTANWIEKLRELLADSYDSVDRHTYRVKKCTR